MINLVKRAWGEPGKKGLLLGLAALTLNTLVLFLVNIGGAGLLTLPSFGLVLVGLVVPWLVVLGLLTGVTLFLNSVFSLIIVFYYALHGSIAIGLGDGLGGFRFTFISIQLYAFILGVFIVKGTMSSKKGREILGVKSEEEFVKGFENRATRFGIRVFSWVDALLDAAIMVVLINIFIFQLYVVPTESMVPTLLVNDRPFVIKITEGPKLPVTNFGLPRLRQPDRGDILVVRNPRYDQSPAAEARKLMSDVVYMLTFTGVLLDKYDESGEIKADPLVKRIIGVPGETLEMVNQVIYHKIPGGQFEPLEKYNPDQFPDLFDLPPDILPLVREFPIDERGRTFLDRIDALGDPRTQELSYVQYFAQLAAEVDRIGQEIDTASNRLNPRTIQESFLAEARTYGTQVSSFQTLETYTNDQVLALALALDQELRSEFRAFLTSSNAYPGDSRFYQQASILNLLVKKNLAQLLLSTFENLGLGSSGVEVDRRAIITQINELYTYLRYYNLRGFPPFPSETEPLAADQYFFMGDNRLNSLDARHGDYRDEPLDPSDPQSILFTTNLSPRSVSSSSLVGWTGLRVFPFSRFGIFN
ncbi:MAG: signal peptidase I [Spirochaetales bacterium]|nr:signal peptidase I [Spirochaetales bacterium]